MNHKLIIAATAALALAACDNKQEVANPNPSPSHVSLVAVAPDGTHLWVTDGNVYFASSGTSHSRSCGKSCRTTDRVPTDESEAPGR